jgi:hypothetical protein
MKSRENSEAMTTSTGHTLRAEQAGSRRRLLPIIILVALAIRMVVVLFTFRGLPFAEEYLSHAQFGWEMGWIARALASGHGFSSPYYFWSGATAMQPPLYPFLLAGVFRLFGIYSLTSGFVILSINSLLSALTCIPIYYSAKYSLGARAVKIAAWIWALYPFAIYFSAGRVWEYALTGLLFSTCFCVAQRIHHSAKPLAWLGRALRPHRALQPRDTLPVAVSARGGDLECAPHQPSLAAQRHTHRTGCPRRSYALDGAQLPHPGHSLPCPRQLLAGVLLRKLR